MMLDWLRRWLWALGIAAVLVWTLLAAIVAWAIGQTTELVAWLEGPLAGMPNLVESAGRAAAFAEPVGSSVIWVVWLAGAMFALGCTAAFARLLKSGT